MPARIEAQPPVDASKKADEFSSARGTARSLGETPPQPSALAAAGRFLRGSWIAALAVSAAALVPCFWHRRIEAGDLASHTYNAWLAQLIGRGQAPGLWLARQWNNVLFDVSLSGLGSLIGLRAAEKICVSLAVLIFFWGAFAMIAAMARRAPWPLAPCIAMIAYGYTFQQGFMNYYISVGLAFFGVALLHAGKGLERALIVLLLPLAWFAHPLGAVILGCLGLYVMAASIIPAGRQMILAASAALLMITGIIFVAKRYFVVWSNEGYLAALLSHTGADQLLLYGERYWLPSALFIVFVLACATVDAPIRRKQGDPLAISFSSLPLHLYMLVWFGGVLLPKGIVLPHYAAPLSMLTPRLTSVTAVLACCLLAVARPQKWHLPSALAIAGIFFFFLYGDTGRLNHMEEEAERYERVLPPGQRIVATIWPFRGSQLFINHVVDRACIGQCFSYSNYEPSSGQFRVRAEFGNRIVMSNAYAADQAQAGVYFVRAEDLPLFEIYQCDLNMTELCMRELTAGERNGAVGVQLAH